MSEEKNIPPENSKQEVNENDSSVPLFPEDKQAPAIKEPKTVIDKQETENMEVHHHGHVHEKKKWKEYLFQFLMLFLAVFLGFLAENQREHVVERSRAKEYAKSLLIDLKNDTADITRAAFYDNLTNLTIDSLINFISDAGTNKKSGQFYYYMRLAGWFYTVDWNKATINQLINSGNLRYFTDPQLVTKISVYSTIANTISDLQETIRSHRDRASTSRDQILKSQYSLVFLEFTMDDLYHGKRSAFIDSLKNTDLPLQSNDPELLNSYANAILSTKSNRAFLLKTLYPKAIKEAIEIMQLLKKEYHFK